MGLDLTRRDLQTEARQQGKPWDTAKALDQGAPITAIHPTATIGHVTRGRIWLDVNGEERQAADVADMIWNVSEVVAELSRLFELRPGDLVFTGTPAGVGPLRPGDRVRGGVQGVDVLQVQIV